MLDLWGNFVQMLGILLMYGAFEYSPLHVLLDAVD
jgi:hypothetical protein